MNFTQAYWFAKQGYSIKRSSYPQEFTCRMLEFVHLSVEDYAATDWIVTDPKANPPTDVIEIKFKRIWKDGWFEPMSPYHAHVDDRGFDLYCAAKEEARDEEGNIIPNTWRYHSGLAFQFPDGIDAEFRARSSVYKTGLMLSNGVGTIDHGYRGEVQAVFYDVLKTPSQHYKLGERFGQLVIPGVDPRCIEFIQVDEIEKTDRGEGGYGSSGK